MHCHLDFLTALVGITYQFKTSCVHYSMYDLSQRISRPALSEAQPSCSNEHHLTKSNAFPSISNKNTIVCRTHYLPKSYDLLWHHLLLGNALPCIINVETLDHRCLYLPKATVLPRYIKAMPSPRECLTIQFDRWNLHHCSYCLPKQRVLPL